MNAIDILQRIIDNHNRLIQIPVSGDGAILMANTILDLRNLAEQLGSNLNQNTEKSDTEESKKDG